MTPNLLTGTDSSRQTMITAREPMCFCSQTA